ncbi:hypothetical protein [Pseudothauera rhizosphaerae]|uniref:Uncharacterized protein n=1 Tax=Pseudothauera rhizosphaerae TaxID=2565932 RepID=A0A4S4AWE3_9RHOO|nr:hypothetical protein [Pseudothauera rhizosphaerae]THF64349.1 hypothetical protein E6O51_03295 [Pseudothauera rhizosphaerae]
MRAILYIYRAWLRLRLRIAMADLDTILTLDWPAGEARKLAEIAEIERELDLVANRAKRCRPVSADRIVMAVMVAGALPVIALRLAGY